eukprot:2431304-Ditylum_brightwellii.AAC.1
MDLMHLVVSGGQRGEKGRWVLTAMSTTRDADNALARTHVTLLQLQLPNPHRNRNHSTVADKE